MVIEEVNEFPPPPDDFGRKMKKHSDFEFKKVQIEKFVKAEYAKKISPCRSHFHA